MRLVGGLARGVQYTRGMRITIKAKHVTDYNGIVCSGWVATATDESGKALVSTWPEGRETAIEDVREMLEMHGYTAANGHQIEVAS
jgi:hypothetical protein